MIRENLALQMYAKNCMLDATSLLAPFCGALRHNNLHDSKNVEQRDSLDHKTSLFFHKIGSPILKIKIHMIT